MIRRYDCNKVYTVGPLALGLYHLSVVRIGAGGIDAVRARRRTRTLRRLRKCACYQLDLPIHLSCEAMNGADECARSSTHHSHAQLLRVRHYFPSFHCSTVQMSAVHAARQTTPLTARILSVTNAAASHDQKRLLSPAIGLPDVRTSEMIVSHDPGSVQNLFRTRYRNQEKRLRLDADDTLAADRSCPKQIRYETIPAQKEWTLRIGILWCSESCIRTVAIGSRKTSNCGLNCVSLVAAVA